METKYCNCVNQETIVASTVGRFLYTQSKCSNCGRMFTKKEELFSENEWFEVIKNRNDKK